MKYKIQSVLVLFVVALSLVSCLKDDDTTSDVPTCAITSFSIGDLTSYVTVKKSNGSDTVYTRTIGGSNIYFNIDQVNNRIFTVDSIAPWANLKRVLTTATSTGTIYFKQATDSLYYRLTSGKDSLDYTSPVTFFVIAPDGKSTRTYTATINKAATDADSLVWTQMSSSVVASDAKLHTVAFGKRLFAFVYDGESVKVSSASLADDCSTWTEAASLNVDGIVYNSVLAFGGALYAIGSDGSLYKTTDSSRAVVWAKVADAGLKSLLAADKFRMYGYDGTSLLTVDAEGNTSATSSSRLNLLPDNGTSFVCYPSKTNSNLYNVIMAGASAGADDNEAVWYKVSSSGESDQDWNYVDFTLENNYACPKLENMQIVYYGDKVLALGGKGLSDTSLEPYSSMYHSDDNGITWKKYTSLVLPPSALVGSSQDVSMIACDGYIWLMQSGGKVWRGFIRGN